MASNHKQQQAHGDRAHALLSPSGASRWLNCPPSARLEEKFPEQKANIFADEGTLAHELGELELRNLQASMPERKYRAQRDAIKAHKLYHPEMPEQVAKYVDYVWEEFVASDTNPKGTGAELIIEQKTDLTDFVPEGFGMCDSIVIADQRMKVIDLKYGKGITVDAEKNSQLMLYGLGALVLYDMAYDIKEVELTVHQPRLNHVSTWTISASELLSWGAEVVAKYADMAFKGKGKFFAGGHCRWCRAAGACRTLANKNLEIAKHDFKEPALLEDDELIKVYNQLDRLTDWAKSVKGYLLQEAIAGKKWEGLKVVEGKSNRKWVDEHKALTILKDEGYMDINLVNTKIKGIGDIERILKKDKKQGLMSDLTFKPQGAPTLVDESDKRGAYNPAKGAKDDFA